jgi:hypothetical protein
LEALQLFAGTLLVQNSNQQTVKKERLDDVDY